MRVLERLLSLSVAALLAMLVAISSSGCAQQRQWDGCALAGAIIGAGVGATSGIVIADNTAKRHLHDKRSIGGGVGAVAGALIAAVAMHYLCDPLVEQPQPQPPPAVAEAAPPPLPPPAPVVENAPAKRIVLRGVHFEFNKADVRVESEPILDEAAQVLNRNPGITIDVNGYTDAIGSESYNVELSERRATAVAQYLQAKGVSPARLLTRGFGKTNFVATNETDEGRAQNRRVELIPASS